MASLSPRGRSRRILFVHDRAPGQFGDLALWLARRGWDVLFATARAWDGLPGVRVLPYAPHRAPSPLTHPYAQPMDRAAIRAQAFVRAALKARRAGYRPDVVVSHAGLSAGAFVKDVFPEAAFVPYVEWWYNHPGPDVAFLAALGYAPSASVEAPMHERARNAPLALDLAAADAAICPTRFQAAQVPAALRGRLQVMGDGVDADLFRPAPAGLDRTLGGLVPADAPVVTYATRGMEPHRGFPQFMAALSPVLAARPDAHVLIAGENAVSYGGDALRSVDWRARALRETDLDPARVRFVGTLDRPRYLRLLQRSDAHVYLTVPFVLSWSMLEAMSVGAPLVLSDTAPVWEFAGSGEARLAAFRAEAIAAAVLEALEDPSPARRRASRERVEAESCLAAACRRRERLLAALAA